MTLRDACRNVAVRLESGDFKPGRWEVMREVLRLWDDREFMLPYSAEAAIQSANDRGDWPAVVMLLREVENVPVR